jgi:hypothetical protein
VKTIENQVTRLQKKINKLRKIKTKRDTRAERERENTLIKKNHKKFYKHPIMIFSVI